MRYLLKLLSVLGVNGIMLWGLGFDGWSGSTALAIYWFENVINSVLITLRIAVHRRVSRKRGHFRPQLGVRVNEQALKTFLAEFATASLAFTAGHGVFLVVALYFLFQSAPDVDVLWLGAAGVSAFHLLGFFSDLVGMRERPFAWIKAVAQAGLGRIVLVHLAIIGGMAVVAITKSDRAFFLPFACLKLLVDVGSVFGQQRRMQRAPGWLVRLINHLKPGRDFAAYLAAENVKELAREAQDEEIVGE